MTASNKDTLYSSVTPELGNFRFDDAVAGVFQDMISRSVPGYELTLESLGVLAKHYCTSNTNAYDLGCSLGASTLAISHNAPKDCTIIGVDNAEAMVKRCKQNIDEHTDHPQVSVELADVRDLSFDNCSFIAMNFILMFIPENDRAALLASLFKGLNSGGALVLSEKIAASGKNEQTLLTDFHHDFKRQRGYSELEVSRKRQAIENVLIPDTIDTHKERLHAAGFSQVILWFQCFTFASFIAIK